MASSTPRTRSAQTRVRHKSTSAPSTDAHEAPVQDARPHTRVFINYRRDDTGDVAEFLERCLTERLGSGSVFRDVVTIEPGDPFPQVIQRSICESSCLLALIGRTWLTAREPSGRRRLSSPEDLVRKEIELAMQQNVPVIPVLVDGARMPALKDLPKSIAALAERNAYELPWHEGVVKLQARIEELDRLRELARYDLTGGKKIEAGTWDDISGPKTLQLVTAAMQISLTRQGSRLSLDPDDIGRTLAALSKLKPTAEGMQPFYFQDLIYVIDILGVAAKGSSDRIVARSFALSGLEDVPGQLLQGRPVLAQMLIHESWNRPPAVTTGVVSADHPGEEIGDTLGIMLGMDRLRNEFRVLTPYTWWGDRGWAILSMAAAVRFVRRETLRSIEAAPMPKPRSITSSVDGASTHAKSASTAKATKRSSRKPPAHA